METRLLSFSDKRLARLFRRAALQHIRRELPAAAATLSEAQALLEGDSRATLGPALEFVREWGAAVRSERGGTSLHTAPAAWIHLSQELASVIDAGGDWVSYLGSRWRVESGRMGWARRSFYACLSLLAFLLSGAIALMLARHAAAGSWEGLGVGTMRSFGERSLAAALLLGRVAGTFMMAEHGFLWGRRALSGKAEEPRVVFLGRVEGLALAEPPAT